MSNSMSIYGNGLRNSMSVCSDDHLRDGFGFSCRSDQINNDASVGFSCRDNVLKQLDTKGNMFYNSCRDVVGATNNSNSVNPWEESSMSFAGVVHFGSFAIAVSDTRSTTKFAVGSREYNDDYRKIVRVPNTNIVAIATGRNVFQSKSFEEIVSETESTELFRVYCELSGRIKAHLFREETVSIIISEHQNQTTAGVLCTVRPESIESDVFNFIDNAGKGIFIGQDWAVNLAVRTDFAEYQKSEQDAINAIRNFVKNLTEISPVISGDGGSIGGNIQITVLKTDREPEFLPLQ
jgi:hypothetical protein